MEKSSRIAYECPDTTRVEFQKRVSVRFTTAKGSHCELLLQTRVREIECISMLQRGKRSESQILAPVLERSTPPFRLTVFDRQGSHSHNPDRNNNCHCSTAAQHQRSERIRPAHRGHIQPQATSTVERATAPQRLVDLRRAARTEGNGSKNVGHSVNIGGRGAGADEGEVSSAGCPVDGDNCSADFCDKGGNPKERRASKMRQNKRL